MEQKFTVEEIKRYIMSQDSLGDVFYNLNAENIKKANYDAKSVWNCEYFDEAQGRNKCLCPFLETSRCDGICEEYKEKEKE